MSFDSAIYAVLAADITLGAITPGGVYLRSALGKYGFAHTSPIAGPVAWDKNGIMKPSVVVKGRSVTPDYQIHDVSSQYVSTRGIVEVYLYQNGDIPADPLEAIAQRIYTLLQDKNILGLGTVRLANQIDNFYDPSLEFALTWRRDYQPFSANKGS